MRPARTAAIEGLILSTIRAEPQARARRRRHRIITWGAIGLLAVGGAATAGAVIASSAKITNTEEVHCLSSATRDADGGYPGSAATIAQEDGPGRVVNAIELCTQMWAQGVLSKGYDPRAATNPPGQIPEHFVVCVMKDGSAAVVPTENRGICQALGLAPM